MNTKLKSRDTTKAQLTSPNTPMKTQSNLWTAGRIDAMSMDKLRRLMTALGKNHAEMSKSKLVSVIKAMTGV